LRSILVDDHLLLRILVGDTPIEIPHGSAVATTGLWYHRLCRALSDDAVVGSMSRRLGAVDETIAVDVLGAVVALPDTIELISLRTLGWPMADLVHGGARLNLLALEALAAARHLDADIYLAAADDNPPLRAAGHAFGVAIRTIDDRH
jgi:hypothetical protein